MEKALMLTSIRIVICLLFVQISTIYNIAHADLKNNTSKFSNQKSRWDGYYIGLNSGWLWSQFEVSLQPIGTTANNEFIPQNFNINSNGAFWGGDLGYNRSSQDGFLYGVEVDMSGLNLNATQQTVTNNQPLDNAGLDRLDNGFSINDKIKWILSVRGRLGAFINSSLLYFTAGGAWKDTSYTDMVSLAGNVNFPAGQSHVGTTSKIKSGYVVGAGYESHITTAWTVRCEYMFYGFNDRNTHILRVIDDNNVANAFDGNITVRTRNNNINLLRIGMNYLIA